jgi:hypothetical protein
MHQLLPQLRICRKLSGKRSSLEHGGEYPETMPQAIRLTDAEGRSCIYVPITQDGKMGASEG